MKEMWDERYSASDYAYGTSPNLFFKDSLEKYNIRGKILLPGEGEGRNAVFAAQKGLEVTAFDISIEGKRKAQRLAESQNVLIKYEVGDFLHMNLPEKFFDAAGLISAHFPQNLRKQYHQRIGSLIKYGGILILEGFAKNNLPLREANPKVGGPKNIDLLYTKECIQNDFSDFDVLQLEEAEVELKEGEFHDGIAKMIRFVGRKI